MIIALIIKAANFMPLQVKMCEKVSHFLSREFEKCCNCEEKKQLLAFSGNDFLPTLKRNPQNVN